MKKSQKWKHKIKKLILPKGKEAKRKLVKEKQDSY